MSNLDILHRDFIHQLSNPIGAISARIELLRMKKADLLREDEYLANALAKIERDLAEVKSILAELRQVLKSPEAIEPVALGALLSATITSIDIPDSVEIMTEIEDEIPDVLATKGLADVFRNLITNAIDALPDGGKIKIQAKANKDAGQVEITFDDSGKGIPPFLVSSLFKPYYSTKEGEGHGLGLWWSRAYLESIGGKIELVSTQVGKGSLFLLVIPTAK